MNEILDLTKDEVKVIKPSLYKNNDEDEEHSLFHRIRDDKPIIGFIGMVETTLDKLEEFVPVGFPDRMNEVPSGEQGEESVKTFGEYCFNNYFESVNDGKILLIVGRVDEHNNLKEIVSDGELRAWIDEFGFDNVKTKSEADSLVKKE